MFSLEIRIVFRTDRGSCQVSSDLAFDFVKRFMIFSDFFGKDSFHKFLLTAIQALRLDLYRVLT